VGGVIAIAVISKGYASVKWSKVGMIIASWFISPAMSCLAAFCIYMIIKKCVLAHPDSMRRAKLSAPIFVFIVTFVVALFTIYKGGKGLGLHKTTLGMAIGLSAAVSLVAALAAYPFVSWWARKIMEKEGQAIPPELQDKLEEPSKGNPEDNQTVGSAQTTEDVIIVDLDEALAARDDAVKPKEAKKEEDEEKVVYTPTEQLFTGPVVIIAGFFSLAHGANDVANSVGPFGAVLAAFDGPLEKKTEIPLWVFVAAGIAIVIGLATFGIHVMQTIGNKITPITPPKAFVVNFAATLVVLIATKAGIPISTTHASVGAVVGVGLADGAGNVSWKMMSKVFLSWILTLPIVGISAAGIFAMLLPCVVDVPFETIPK
jgi:sodium-dependent phosphate transporter